MKSFTLSLITLAMSVLAHVAVAVGPQPTGRVVDGRVYCVANSAVPPEVLQTGLDFACSQIDCADVQSGGACGQPDNIYSHASWVYNNYFQMKARFDYNCYFNNTALVTFTDPSYGNCTYLFK